MAAAAPGNQGRTGMSRLRAREVGVAEELRIYALRGNEVHAAIKGSPGRKTRARLSNRTPDSALVL
jgi:hypothetical protein